MVDIINTTKPYALKKKKVNMANFMLYIFYHNLKKNKRINAGL